MYVYIYIYVYIYVTLTNKLITSRQIQANNNTCTKQTQRNKQAREALAAGGRHPGVPQRVILHHSMAHTTYSIVCIVLPCMS